MIVDIGRLSKGACVSVAFTKYFNVLPEYGIANDCVMVKVSGKLCKSLDYFSFDGTIEAELELCCDLCLKPTTVPLAALVHERFIREMVLPKTEATQPEALEIFNDVSDFWTFEGSTIDLTDCVESNLLLNIPYKVQCKEDCKGLCRCGHDLNESPCTCEESHSDDLFAPKSKNKFEALRSLFQDREV